MPRYALDRHLVSVSDWSKHRPIRLLVTVFILTLDTLADTLAEQNTRLQNYEQLIDQQKVEIEELKDQIERSLATTGGSTEHYRAEISLLKKQNQQFRAELEKNVAKIYKLQDSRRDLM